ncbi:MAG: DUF4911 domain-containing protein [Betaproteobacteria bacterium]|nr:DUF4911 domain-containing protein [Betaproteobacteria bacterium]
MAQVPHPRKKKARKPGPALPPPRKSLRFLVRLAPQDVGMFRFLIEAYDNLAYFTVLDAREALLSVVCSPHQEYAVRHALEEIGGQLPLRHAPWPSACTRIP